MWAIALAVDYLGPVVIGMGPGWRVTPTTTFTCRWWPASVLFARGLKTTLGDVGTLLETVPRSGPLRRRGALPARAHRIPVPRDGLRLSPADSGAAALLALIPAALTIPALTALALVSAVCSLVVAYEAIRHREARGRLRHRDLTA